MKIAIGFFGITRSLSWTLESINERIVSPLKTLGEVKTFASLIRQKKIVNQRSREDEEVDPDEYKMLGCQTVVLQEPGACLEKIDMARLLRYGDSWGDNGKSLSNLVHQLSTLDALHQTMLPYGADLIVFLRPDLYYHDDFISACRTHASIGQNSITVPDWQWARGMNDRFSICDPHSARAYATRIKYMHKYVDETRKPLNSEEFLWWTLNRFKVKYRLANLRASRIRSNGYSLLENFQQLSLAKRFRRRVVNQWHRSFGWDLNPR